MAINNKHPVQAFVTFGSDHLDNEGSPLGGKYMLMSASTWRDLRDKTVLIRGLKFCTDYDIKDLPRQKAKWGITEVTVGLAQLTEAQK